MLGCYDFCGHYEWTFGWMEREGGHAFVLAYWDEGISRDSQTHARELIISGGFDGMATLKDYGADPASPMGGLPQTVTHQQMAEFASQFNYNQKR